MPWHKVEGHADCPSDKPWAVVKDADGEVEGCHASEGDADSQIAALYASEGESAAASVASIYSFATPPTVVLPGDQERTHGDEYALPIEAYSLGHWRGVLAVEGVETGDTPRREFGADALIWRDLPLPLMWQKQTAEGHMQSVIVGRHDEIERDGAYIRGKGLFDVQGADGAEAHRLVYNRFIRGLSVTLDDMNDNDIEFVWPEEETAQEEGEPVEDPMAALFMEPEKVLFHHARIIDTVLTGQPALQEAFIELVPDAEVNVEHPDDEEPILAGAPLAPPLDWFQNPQLPDITPLTVEESGRIYGHLAKWGVCHTSFSGTCITPPFEQNYGYFTTGEILTREGARTPVGQLTLGTNHAPSGIGARPAAAHYEHTGHAAADVAVGADDHGIWVAGAVRPELGPRALRTLRASALSGDWRRISGSLRLVAALVVNVPGFPIPRTRTYAREGVQTALVASGVVASVTASSVVSMSSKIADRIAMSVGRDHASRARDLQRRVHPSAGNLED